MKKLSALLTTFSILVFFGCTQTQKLIKFSPSKIKGSWTLSSINYSKKGNFKANLFNDADKDCFVGSQWNLISNNYTGTYTLSSSLNCSSESKPIIWDVLNLDGFNYFQFKRKIQDVKAKFVQSGYRLKIDEVSEFELRMSQDTSVDGEPMQLIYTFIKNNQTK